jgi:DNA-directed DNA polymerase III PolC
MGNNLPKDMVARAKENGFTRTAITDDDSMSAIIRYIQASKNEEMGAVAAATLSVYMPERDESSWIVREEKHFNKTLKLPEGTLYADIFTYHALSKAKVLLVGFSSALNDPTPRKIKNGLSKYRDEVGEFSSLLASGEDFNLMSDTDIKKRGADVLFSELLAQHIPELKNVWDAPGSWHSFISMIKSIDFNLPVGKLMFFAKSMEGYKNLLSLASLKAKRKHDSIAGVWVGPHAILWDEIETFKEDIVIIDPLEPYSVLGGVLHAGASKEEKQRILHAVSAQLKMHVDNIGIPYSANDEIIEWAKSSEFNAVPLVTAHFSEKQMYDEYCVKVAVHRSEIVTDFTFSKPNTQKYIPNKSDVDKYYSQTTLSFIDASFWEDQISNTQVPLGEVFLPSYDMQVIEVVKHAFKLKHSKEVDFQTNEAALFAFDEEIINTREDDVSLTTLRQKSLNEYCLHFLAMQGLDFRLKQQYHDKGELHREAYMERINHEFKVITDMGFPGYFLIEYDFVSYAREIGVPVGPGRGSAAGSLIVYCLEITDVDPIQYDLPFERFLNPERVSMPDIDVDFGDGGDVDRYTVLAYIKEKYQQEGSLFPSSSQIANISRYQLKSAIAAVRNAYGLTMTFDRALKLMIKEAEQTLGISEPESVKWKDFLSLDFVKKRMSREPMLRRVLMMAQALTGKMAAYGVHAGGVVISPTVIPDFAPLACDDKGKYFSQLDKDDIEDAGLIKFDVLGLRTLSVLAECLNQVSKTRGVDIDIRTINFSDEKVYDLICDRVLEDVFQLESRGMQELVGNLLPRTVGEIAVLSSLFRTGPLESGMVDEYIDVKKGARKPTYDHPAIKIVTENTLGCIVYQEQVMSIVRELAGYSLGQADLLRRAMGKKKVDEMAKQRDVYMQKAMGHWREHYIEIGQKQEFTFTLDVNLSDIEEHLTALGLSPLDSSGFISSQSGVIECMKILLSLSENEVKNLGQRLSDYNYIVALFKNDYQKVIETAVHKKLDIEKDKQVEVYSRLYYALSQYVRFNQVFNKLEKFAGYGFNKSHAIAYSVVSYMTAYLKCHYPAEFYAAAMSFKDLDRLHGLVLEATSKMNIKVGSPHINKSEKLFHVESEGLVRYGLGKLKGVGQSAMSIIEERNTNGPYTSLADFLVRLANHTHSPSKTAFGSLAVTGAFDDFTPRRVARDRQLNGRQFTIWFREQFIKSKLHASQDKMSGLHLAVDDMSELEFYAYLNACSPIATIKQLPFKEPIDSASAIVKAEHAFYVTDSIKSLSQKVTAKNKVAVIEGCKQLSAGAEMSDENITMRVIRYHESGDVELTDFEWKFLSSILALSSSNDLLLKWKELLIENVKKAATETLNEEREAAGFYMTSNPLRVLKISDRVEREPPSSIIDGCPVEVGRIDASYDERNVTTYGIVRNVEMKTVKKQDSPSFGEKMLFFDLENGPDIVSCMVFGDKPVNFFYKKIIEDGVVALVAGQISLGDFGITLRPNAIKRYYPVEDEAVMPVRQ